MRTTSIAALGLLLAGAAFLVLGLFAHWFKWREIVLKRPSWRISHCVAALIALLVPSLYGLPRIQDTPIRVLSGLILLYFLVDGRKFFAFLTELIPLRERDLQLVFSQFPPRERLDLLPFDLAIGAVLIMPFAARAIH